MFFEFGGLLRFCRALSRGEFVQWCIVIRCRLMQFFSVLESGDRVS